MNRRWSAPPVPAAAAALRAAGLLSPIAEILAQRGIDTSREARRFLAPAREHLCAADELPDFPAAVDRLHAAATGGERVLVVGDYDVDGVTAAALIQATLGALGASVETVLPRRDGEGYGLQPLHVRHAVAAGAGLIVAVDSGTDALDAWREARRLGIELVVVDHHLASEESTADPGRPIVLNPRRGGAPAAAEGLTAAGLASRLAAVLFERAGRDVPWDGLLRLACLGTIADVAPLRGDNRVLASLGLAAMERTPSPGLRALLRSAAVRPPVAAADVAFRIAPRLNAAGRIGSADDALELLLTRDEERARELAALLERRNAERQALERRILSEARERVAERPALPPIVVLASPQWHVGVVGVAAARLARELHRPTILLACGDGAATGSGRSVAGLALHELVAPLAPRLERFGGHAQAIGLTVRIDGIESLREELERAAEQWSAALSRREIRYDLDLAAEAIGRPLLDALDSLGPFGAGHPEPVFRLGPGICERREPFGRGHVRLEVRFLDQGERSLRAVWWRGAEQASEISREPIELLAAVERDRFDGVRLRVVDLRGVEAPSD